MLRFPLFALIVAQVTLTVPQSVGSNGITTAGQGGYANPLKRARTSQSDQVKTRKRFRSKEPSYWNLKPHSRLEIDEVTDQNKIRKIQDLVDGTHLKEGRSCDRRGKVPNRFEVVNVKLIQSRENWDNFVKAKEEITQDLLNTDAFIMYNQKGDEGAVKTFKAAPSWRETLGAKEEPVTGETNDYYMWHGTKSEVAEKIAETNFRIDLAGTNVGTMYGKGSYQCESITKADEYTKPDEDGVRWFLLSRVICGKIKYTKEESPNADALEESCTKGEYHSVCGDRRFICGDSFREHVVFDSRQILPEFLVGTRRHGEGCDEGVKGSCDCWKIDWEDKNKSKP